MATNTETGPSQAGKTQPRQGTKQSLEKQDVKILMLHGYAQTGPLFRAKTGAMSKMLAKALPTINATRSYPTGPHKLRPEDIPGFQPREGAEESAAEPDVCGWFLHDEEPGLLRGLNEGMHAIADAIQEAGGVDGVLGFSQGGAVAALVAAALEADRPLPDDAVQSGWARRLREANGGRSLRFCVVYSGYVARPGAQLGWLYQGGIKTPSYHCYGSMDTVVEEPRCQALADSFIGSAVVVHPGGHHVPMRKEWVAPLLGFLKKVLEDDKLATQPGA